MTETFYDVLGVAEDATTEEIQSAYRDRLKDVHPDVNDDDDAGQTTRRLVEARDVLVDETERARYDRLGHDAYVGAPSGETTDATTDTEEPADGGDRTDPGPRDRATRERQASQRVRQERARRTETGRRTDDGGVEGTPSEQPEDHGQASARADDSRTDGYGPNGAPAEVNATTYSVRTEVEASNSFGPLLPSGSRLTLLGMFFALYPVLLFSALLPAFPLVVNLVVGAVTVVTIGYLQSMPRVALLVFGGWSVIGVLGLLVFGVSAVSLLGLAVLGGTVLPFGFSVLTAAALRY